MKKNRTTKIAIIVLALVLATSCFVGTTLARYTTKITGNDTARIAKFGVVLTAATDLFEEKYDKGADAALITVDGQNGANVIAPGTSGTATIFTISGTPEVDVNVLITLNDYNALKMVTLPAGDYRDWTNLNNPDKYNVAANYYPVKWTLAKNGQAIPFDGGNLNDVNLQTIENYLVSISKVYHVTEDGNELSTINGSYTLSWKWDFNGNDAFAKEDTTLGQIMAGVETAPTGYCEQETFFLNITVTQVD